MSSTQADPGAASRPVSPASGLVLSCGFWACVAAAGVLFGSVALAPRAVERSRLERSFADRQSELLTLQANVANLERVAAALRQQPAAGGTATTNPGSALAVDASLRFDPRAPSIEPIDVTYEEPWYLPILTGLCDSPERRLRWSLLAAGLLTFGFVFLHEHAGSRSVGRTLLLPLRSLARRYSRTS